MQKSNAKKNSIKKAAASEVKKVKDISRSIVSTKKKEKLEKEDKCLRSTKCKPIPKAACAKKARAKRDGRGGGRP